MAENTPENPAQGANPAGAVDQANLPQLQVLRVYAKDISFEAPNLPELYQMEYKPQVKFSMNTKSRQVGPEAYEVILGITLTATLENEKTAYLVEIQQAAMFGIRNIPQENIKRILSTTCPDIIFPYARETVTNMIQRAGFPVVLLSHVDFNLLYEKQLADERNNANGQQPEGAGVSNSGVQPFSPDAGFEPPQS